MHMVHQVKVVHVTHQVNMIISEHDALSTSIAKMQQLHNCDLLQTALGIVKLQKHQLMLTNTSGSYAAIWHPCSGFDL